MQALLAAARRSAYLAVAVAAAAAALH